MALHEGIERSSPLRVHCPAWQRALPTLSQGGVVLRELRLNDAPSLLQQMADEDVRRHIAPPPTSLQGFRRFIRWARGQRHKGAHLTFGVVPKDQSAAVGIFQVWRIEPDFFTAEWGMALGRDYWGTDVAVTGSKMLLDFAFSELRVHRLEARAGVDNGRGNGILRKLGATAEGRLRHAFRQGDRVEDQRLWSILAEEWSGEVSRRSADC